MLEGEFIYIHSYIKICLYSIILKIDVYEISYEHEVEEISEYELTYKLSHPFVEGDS